MVICIVCGRFKLAPAKRRCIRKLSKQSTPFGLDFLEFQVKKVHCNRPALFRSGASSLDRFHSAEPAFSFPALTGYPAVYGSSSVLQAAPHRIFSGSGQDSIQEPHPPRCCIPSIRHTATSQRILQGSLLDISLPCPAGNHTL